MSQRDFFVDVLPYGENCLVALTNPRGTSPRSRYGNLCSILLDVLEYVDVKHCVEYISSR